jgi:hypothetical protein
MYGRDSPPSFSSMGGRMQSLSKKGPDLPKHHQISQLYSLQGQHSLGPKRKQAVYSVPVLKTHWQIREFWGAAGFCQIWIPNYSLLVKPFYKATKEGEWEPLEWEEEQEKAIRKIKGALTNTPALGLPRHTFSSMSMSEQGYLSGS